MTILKIDWTAERIAELKSLKENGLSASQIGDKMGITRNSVIGKLHRMGQSAGEWHDMWGNDQTETLKTEWALGKTVLEIQAILLEKHNFHRTTIAISSRAYRIGLTKRMDRRRLSSVSMYAFKVPRSPPSQENSPLNIGFMQLENFHCREVTGHGDDDLAIYCGHPKDGEHSFCAFHQRKNYYKPNYDLRKLRGM